jgi:hypothetical protein
MKLHMTARSRFSTPTVIDTEYLVPWLPGILNPQVNLREHGYFGSPLKDSARFFFDFWQMPVEKTDRCWNDTASSDSFQITS